MAQQKKRPQYHTPHLKHRPGFENERDFVFRVWNKEDPDNTLHEATRRYGSRGEAASAGDALIQSLPEGKWRLHAFSPQWPEKSHNPHNFNWPKVPSEDDLKDG